MKKLLAFVMLLCSLCSFAFANEQDAKGSFENFARGVVRDLQTSYSRGDYAVVYFDDVYFADGTSGGWLKMGFDNLQAGVGVYPGESSEALYIASLELANRTIYYCSPANPYGEFKTKEEAEAAMNIAEEGHPNHYRYLYVYRDDQWFFAGEQFQNYDANGNMVWEDSGEDFGPYDRFLIQKRWEGFDGQSDYY